MARLTLSYPLLMSWATRNWASCLVMVLAISGSPSFYTLNGDFPKFVEVGDFNGDGKLDAVSANSGNLSILFGNGSGGLVHASDIPVEAGNNIREIAVADLNGDSKDDLAVPATTGAVVVLLNNGFGGFSTQTSYHTGGPVAAIARDFNRDNKLDLAVANFGFLGQPPGLSILLGDGVGGFSPPTFTETGGSGIHLTAGDFNLDGFLDIATINGNLRADNIGVLLGDGNGGFEPVSNYLIGINAWTIVSGDFTGDGRPEVVAATPWSNDFSVLINLCSATPVPEQFSSTHPVMLSRKAQVG